MALKKLRKQQAKKSEPEYLAAGRQAFTPPELLTVAEWAERNIILPELTCPEPGPLKISRTPYTRGPLEAFNSLWVEWLVLLWGRQLGKSQGVQYPAIGYAIAQDPGPALLLLPNKELAEYTSSNRLQPMIEASRCLRDQITDDRHDYTTLEMKFRRMVLSIAGGGSGTQVMSRPVRYLFRDEIDELKSGVGQDRTDPMKSSEQTTSNFSNRKIVDTSTPTNQLGNVWLQFSSCQAVFEFWLPCPKCGASHPIFWRNIRFGTEERDPEKVSGQAFYECELCGAAIRNQEKDRMLTSGEWRARMRPDAAKQIFEEHGKKREEVEPLAVTQTASLAEVLREHAAKKIGFHLPKWYSPFANGTFGQAAKEFLQAQELGWESMRDWTKFWAALPWREQVLEQATDEIYSLRLEYEEGEVPEQAIVLTGGADVQKGIIFYVVRAWARDAESWLVRAGKCESFEDLAAVFFGSNYQQIETAKQMRVSLANIDSGYRTDEVYDTTRRFHPRARAIKGSSTKMRAPYDSSAIDFYASGKRMAAGIRLWVLDTDYWKDFLVRRMREFKREDGTVIPPKWHFHRGATEEYLQQIVSEQKVQVRNKAGRQVEEWRMKPGHKQNHYLDAESYAAAAADMVGVKFMALRDQKPKAEDAQQEQTSEETERQEADRMFDEEDSRSRGWSAGGKNWFRR